MSPLFQESSPRRSSKRKREVRYTTIVPNFSRAETLELYAEQLADEALWSEVNAQIQRDIRAIAALCDRGEIQTTKWSSLNLMEKSRRAAQILLNHITDDEAQTNPAGGSLIPIIFKMATALELEIFPMIPKELDLQMRVDTDGQYRYAREVARILVEKLGNSGAALRTDPRNIDQYYS